MEGLFGLYMSYWWGLMVPGLILGVIAQMRLKSVYRKYLDVPVENGMSGAQAARAVLDDSGLSEIPVREIPGTLSDHFDPIRRELCLSEENYRGRSIAAVGVAAHEAGHALQQKAAYAPFKVRMALVPMTQFASNAVYWIFMLGLLFGLAKLATFAVVVFAVLALFQIVTLPVEYDASRRAKERLVALGLVQSNERGGVVKVLNAAALTYVAAMVQTIMQLLFFFLLARDGRD